MIPKASSVISNYLLHRFKHIHNADLIPPLEMLSWIKALLSTERHQDIYTTSEQNPSGTEKLLVRMVSAGSSAPVFEFPNLLWHFC
jgi:hypothetical protein